MKIYLKKGNTNYKEKKFVKALEKVFAEKIAKNPNFENEFQPAATYEELQNLYSQYCTESVEFEEVKDEEATQPKVDKLNESEGRVSPNDEVDEAVSKTEFTDNDEEIIDPFNEREPNIRDYVLGGDGFKKEGAGKETFSQTTFGEPTTFSGAFEMPGEETTKTEGSKTTDTKTADSSSSGTKKETKAQPVNPEFDSMTTAKKKRKSEKLAKRLVGITLALCEKGFVWYATKDINESKLVEYELSGEIDLSILLTLENNQESTVKDFFLSMNQTALMQAKYTEEEKQDLIEALAEVLIEKGIAPTPMQDLLLTGGEMLFKKAMDLLTIKTQVNGVLEQLKAIRKEQIKQEKEDASIDHEEEEKENVAARNTEASGSVAQGSELQVAN